jgi:DNA polymerase III subunit delta'
MKFSEFLGNERIVGYFQKAIADGHLGHAYIFSGPAGVGKTLLARLICKTLLCRNPSKDGPCEGCPACHKFESGNHPDFHSYVPDGLYFKIELVRQIIHEASMKPVEASWKTFLLEGVDFMREEAANAFLKVLEEPPGQTVFFLISEAVDALLPTIRSRCQRFSFQPVPTDLIKRWLIERNEYTEEQAAALAPYSHGSLARALTLNADQYREMRERILALLEAASSSKTFATLLDAAKSITVDRSDMPERLQLMEEFIRDLLLLQSSPNSRLIHEDLRQRLTALALRWESAALQTFYENLLETREAILKINANIGLQMQALLLPLKLTS